MCEFRTNRICLTNKCPILSVENIWDKCIINSKDGEYIMKHTVTTYNTRENIRECSLTEKLAFVKVC